MVHAIFSDQPLLARLFDIEHPSGGDNITVNVGHFRPADEADPFASVHAASYRGLYDLADSRPLALHRQHRPVGQSAVRPLSRSRRALGERRDDAMTTARGGLRPGRDRPPAPGAGRAALRAAAMRHLVARRHFVACGAFAAQAPRWRGEVRAGARCKAVNSLWTKLCISPLVVMRRPVGQKPFARFDHRPHSP